MKETRLVNETLYKQGSKVNLPKDLAIQLIQQGFAEEVDKKARKEVKKDG